MKALKVAITLLLAALAAGCIYLLTIATENQFVLIIIIAVCVVGLVLLNRKRKEKAAAVPLSTPDSTSQPAEAAPQAMPEASADAVVSATSAHRDASYSFEALADYVVIDFETTGLSPERDKIIEAAAVRVRNHQPVDSFSELINPGFSVSNTITNLTGITNEMLSGARSLHDVLPEYLAFVGNDRIVGHNVSFDVSFLNQAAKSIGAALTTSKHVDTLRISRRFHPELPHHRLGDMVDYYQIDSDAAHRALADCKSTQQLYERLMDDQDQNPVCSSADRKRGYECTDHAKGYDEWVKAEELRKAGDFDAALATLDTAKAKGYNAPALYKSFAMIYRKIKGYDKEIAILDEALSAPNKIGSAYQELEDRRVRAQELQEKAIAEEQAALEKERQKEERKLAKQAEKEAAANIPRKTTGRAVLQMDNEMNVIHRYDSIAEAVRETGVNSKSIRDAANGVQKRAGGFVWRYEDSM